MNEIKPCPYCGSKNIEVATVMLDWSGSICHSARCLDCLTSGPKGTEQEAIERWNQRAYDYDMPAIVHQNKHLQDVVHALKAENSKLIELVYGDGERDTDHVIS